MHPPASRPHQNDLAAPVARGFPVLALPNIAMGWFTGKKQWRQLEAENAQLRQDNARLKAQVAELQAQNARLSSQVAAARKHSGNSSKPPSSDIVKPKDRGKKKSKRRIGAQKGHPKHQRPAFAPEQINERIPLRLKQCPVDPSHRITPAEGPEHQRILQQVELVEDPFRIVRVHRLQHLVPGLRLVIIRPPCPSTSSKRASLGRG